LLKHPVLRHNSNIRQALPDGPDDKGTPVDFRDPEKRAMKAFLAGVVVAVVIAIAAGVVLENSNTSVTSAFATSSVRN
jgi:hypothetical protein